LNTFVFFFARIAASAITRGQNSRGMEFMLIMLFQMVFGVLASIIVMWFSRYREFSADHGGAELAGRQKMIKALQRLQNSQGESHLDGQLTAFGIRGKGTVSKLFMTHPPLEERIAALQASR